MSSSSSPAHPTFTPSAEGPPADVDANARLRTLVDRNFDFVGRVVRNLGVRGADLDDVVQQAFSVAAVRLDDIIVGNERAFLAQTATRLVANLRRTFARARVHVTEHLPDVADRAPSPEELSDQRRALEILDQLLDAMELDLRTVFVLYEIEEMTMAEIAATLALPPGTVASRLRRAREDFATRLRRLRSGATSPTGGRR